jgi:peptide/nickel transport system permease protein
MQQYIIKRSALALLTLFGVSLIVFSMVRIIPGGVVDQILGDNQGSPEERAAIEHDLGLDKPVIQQYFDWAGGILTLDFGTSLRGGAAIDDRLQTALPTTLELAILALLISLVLAIPIGILSAVKQDSIVDYIGRSLSIGFYAFPSFFLGTLVIVYSSVWFTKATPNRDEYQQFWENPYRNLEFMLFPFGYFVPVGPAVLLGIGLSGTVMRLVRAQMLEVMRQDFVRTARAKGLLERRVIVGHAMKNAFIPVITVIGLQVPFVVGGSVIVESIYNVPGIGIWFFEAIQSRDYTAVQAIALLSAITVVFTNLAVDIAYGYLDPRIRFG